MKPGDIGTRFTTGAIKYLRLNGFDQAELRNQAGANDRGDIIGCPGVAIECKGGKAAEASHPGDVQEWQRQTDVERINSKAEIGVLVTKRKGVGEKNAGDWWAWMRLSHLVDMRPMKHTADFYRDDEIDVWVRMTLREAVWLLRHTVCPDCDGTGAA